MKKKILIIDDDVNLLGIIQELLSPEFTVLSINNHPDLTYISQLSPNLILLDHWMPITSGADFCRKMKDSVATRHIPVVLLSAVANLSGVAAFVEADDYLKKPFDLHEMMSVVRKYL